MNRFVILMGAAIAVAGCERSADDPARAEGPEIVGTWEVVGEPDAPYLDEAQRPGYTAERHRYVFAPDSTLRIFRPRPLGPASTIFAVYDFRGDTLVIRSDFDAGYYLPVVTNDTLYLNPVNSGRPLTLYRIAGGEPAMEPPPAIPPGGTGDYSPPSDLPPDEMPQD